MTSWRTSPALAWTKPYLEINAANSYPAVILDCDDRETVVDAIQDGVLPEPNWIVTNLKSGYHHVAWCLAAPVHRYPEARIPPLRYFRRIAERMGQLADADPGYAGVLTRNPMAAADPHTRTTWLAREPYSLDVLAKVLPFGWKPPVLSRTSIGRNVDLFRSLMRWAGQRENLAVDVFTAALTINQQFATPLPLSEVRATACQVEKYRARWAAYGWHRLLWLARKAAAGRKSGAARRAAVEGRDRSLLTAVLAGEAMRAVARAHGVSEGTVRYVMRRDAPLWLGA